MEDLLDVFREEQCAEVLSALEADLELTKPKPVEIKAKWSAHTIDTREEFLQLRAGDLNVGDVYAVVETGQLYGVDETEEGIPCLLELGSAEPGGRPPIYPDHWRIYSDEEYRRTLRAAVLEAAPVLGLTERYLSSRSFAERLLPDFVDPAHLENTSENDR